MQAWEYALELRNETFEWWTSEKGRQFGQAWTKFRNPRSPVSNNAVHAVEARKLSLASPFYVTPEMCDLLEHATKTFPATELRPDDLMVPAGFVLLATPHIVNDVRGEPLPVAAFAWGIAGSTEDPTIARGLHMSLYSHLSDDPEREMVEDAWGIDHFPTLSLLHETAWVFGEDYSADAHWGQGTKPNMDMPIPPEAIQSGVEMMRFMHTFLILSWQRIAEPVEHTASRAVRKRTARLIPREVPNVRVIQLRRYRDEDREIDPNSRGREYSHRWMVNAFWRSQPYGPGNRLRRPVWIAPHIRGPKDKPLVLKDTAYVWRR